MPERAGALVQPWDEFNRELVAQVHPLNWRNPSPKPRYHLVVIGAGTAGLVAAAGAAGLGAKVALVEKHLMGGDCLNVGCVPSKTLIRAARAAYEAKSGERFGVRTDGVEVDFGKVMERVRRVRAGISPHDSAQRFTDLGVDVFLGEARFRDLQTVEVDGSRLCFKRAVIATGARAAVPEIPGLRAAGFLTNETIFNLTTLPRRLAVVGGGPIGCELAQAFQRLGAQVTLFHNKSHLLDREDVDAARVVQTRLESEGIRLVLEANLTRVEAREEGRVMHWVVPARRAQSQGAIDSSKAPAFTETCSDVFDAILVAAGRAPNVDGLNLESAGVDYDHRRGVRVDDYLRTTNRRIFAAGDVCLSWKFTHAADFAARLVIQNALFLGRKRLSALTMPWCTYTDPEVAHVGLGECEARDRRLEVTAYLQPLEKVDRALTDGAPDGFVKILVAKGTSQILGATIVAPHAGEVISEVSVAMSAGLGLGQLANVIHPYPTVAEAIRRCGDAYNRTKLTPRIRKLLEQWFRWTG